MNFWQRFFIWSGVVEWIAIFCLIVGFCLMWLHDSKDQE